MKQKIKAKHFKRLRSESQWYKVWETDSLFGSFNDKWFRTILARNEEEAVIRFRKSHNEREYIDLCKTSYQWARYRVQPELKPFERFKTYYR